MADRLAVDSIDREGRTVVLKFRPQARLDPVQLVSLVKQRPELALVPPAALRLTLGLAGSGAEAPASSKPPAPVPSLKKAATRSQAAPSWWTTRARTGEVKPGFTKAEILRPARDDPRAPGGVFAQVGGLLSELLDRR